MEKNYQKFDAKTALHSLNEDIDKAVTTDYKNIPKYKPAQVIHGAPSRLYRIDEDIAKLRQGMNFAEAFSNPVYVDLVKVYREVDLNYQVSSCKNIRKNAVMSKKFLIHKFGIVTNDAQLKTFFSKAWVGKAMDTFLESIFWGFSLLFIQGIDSQGNVIGVESVQRQNINPKTKKITRTPWQIHSGLDFEKGILSSNLIFSTDSEDQHYEGLYSKVATPEIYLHKVMEALADFTIRFGSPQLAYFSDSHDEEKLREIEYYLANFNNISYGIFPKLDDLRLIESSGKSGEVYQTSINIYEKAIAKLILGGDLGAENQFVGSANVRASLSNVLTMNDVNFVENNFNNKLIPKLIKLGLDFLEGVTIHLDKSDRMNPNEEFQNTLQLVNSGKYTLPDTYYHEKFGIPVVSVEPNLFDEPNVSINDMLGENDIDTTDSENMDGSSTVWDADKDLGADDLTIEGY